MMNDVRYRWRGELKYTRMVGACERMYPGMHPADVVSYLRLGEGMTQEQAAEHLGVSLSTIRHWQKPEASIHIVTEREIDAKRANAMRTNERIKSGEIQPSNSWRTQFGNGWLTSE